MATNQFKCASVPSDAFTGTNLVYFNPSDLQKVGKRVVVNGFPFNTATDAAVMPGTIAMNGIQRKCCGVSSAVGDVIEIPVGGHAGKPSSIVDIKIEMEYVRKTKGGTLDVQEVVKFFEMTFKGQYFVENQTLAVVLDPSRKYIARVVSVNGVDSTGGTNMAELVPGESNIIVSGNEACEITLTNVPDSQVDAQQPSILNTKSFNLERLGIGGLKTEFMRMFQEAFASRIAPPSVVKRLELSHLKGVLLYGPPGTGKTLIARKIGEILNCRTPKIINGPELFDKYVGGTEAKVRDLFKEAEAEQASKGDQSGLHLLIFDEFDSMCKQRGSVRDGTGVADNVVNQLLAKIDGVNQLNNVLLIGMTNRKDLIDEAILRPGRFGLHIEIGLPDEPGRVEIFRIHTRAMRENGAMAPDVEYGELAARTKNYSGAEIAGVVASATTNALGRHIDYDNPSQTINAANVMVCMEDFRKVLAMTKPAFGAATDECSNAMSMGILDYGPTWSYLDKQSRAFIDHVSGNSRMNSLSVLLEGATGSGKSAFAAHIGLTSNFPYVKFITSDNLVTYGEFQKANIIRKAFDDAYKSKLSVIVLDDLERLIEYSHLGGRYSNLILQTLLVLIKRPSPPGKKLIVIGTTSLPDVMESLELTNCFSTSLHISDVDPEGIPRVANKLDMRFKSPQDAAKIVSNMRGGLPIKKLLLVLEMAHEEDASGNSSISEESFRDAMSATNNADKYL